MNSAVKDTAHAIINELPDDVSFEELVYQLAFRAHVEEGLQDGDAGRTLSHEEIEREFAEWRRSAGL